MILIINGNGRIGSAVVKLLVEQHNVSPRVLVRDVERARLNFGPALEIVHGDISQPDSITRAMKDVQAVFLCTPVDPNQVEYQGNVVREAKKTGAHIVKVSGLCTTLDSRVDSGRWHAETESQIREAKIPHTFIHPNFFHQNLSFQWRQAADSGVIRSAVAEQPIAMINANDIAAVAAQQLISPSNNETLLLTESRSWTYLQIAECFSQKLKREIKFEILSIENLKKGLMASGQPDWHVKLLLQFNDAFNAGAATKISDVVGRVIRREPISLPEFLKNDVNIVTGNNPFPSK
jgi:NAD(P)H dehydrogenase (quinone)